MTNEIESSAEFEFDESLTENELRLEKLRVRALRDRESRQSVENIIAEIKAEHEASQPERKAAHDKTVRAIEELTTLGISRESAELITRYIPLEVISDKPIKPVKPVKKPS